MRCDGRARSHDLSLPHASPAGSPDVARPSLALSPQRVYYPGLHAAELTAQRLEQGMNYHPEVLLWLAETAAELGGGELQAAVDELLPSDFMASIAPEERAKWQRATEGGVLGLGSMSDGKGRGVPSLGGKRRTFSSSTSMRSAAPASAAERPGVPGRRTHRRALCTAAPAPPAPQASRPAAFAPLLAAQGFVVLDGGLGSMLPSEELLPGAWSAGHLATADGRRAIEAAHLAFLRAGCDVVCTNSYKVSQQLLTNLNFAARFPDAPGDLAQTMLVDSVHLARSAIATHARESEVSGRRARAVLVAATCGPYSISTPFRSDMGTSVQRSEDGAAAGASGLVEMSRFHAQKGRTLLDAGADVLAFETIASVDEARAIARAMGSLHEGEAWVAFTCCDHEHVGNGEKLVDCLAALEGAANITAVGVNCLKPELVLPLIRTARTATTKHLLVYPNSGERWDSREGRREWVGERTQSVPALAPVWHEAGAALIGGCCRVLPDEIAAIREQLSSTRPAHPPRASS